MNKSNTNETIEVIALTAKQIKSRLENSLAYDHRKYSTIDILFDEKPSVYYKLPFSDFKINISEELYHYKLLIEDLNKYVTDMRMIEQTAEVEIYEEKEPENEDEVKIIEEVCEYDNIEEELEDEKTSNGKKAKYDRCAIKVVDVKAIVEKIKNEGYEKNKGKPVIGRREINKLLKPYLLKNNYSMDIDGMDESLTSIDIYLNAVNKIAHNSDEPINENFNNALELNLKDIIDDLEK